MVGLPVAIFHWGEAATFGGVEAIKNLLLRGLDVFLLRCVEFLEAEGTIFVRIPFEEGRLSFKIAS